MFAAHHEKSFVPASFKVSIDQLFDNLESGKRNYCFGKMSWKSLEFWIKNPYGPCLENSAIEVGIEVPTTRNPHVDFIPLKSPHYAPKSTPNTGYDNGYYSFHRAEPT